MNFASLFRAREFYALIVVLALFVLAAWFSQRYGGELESIVSRGFRGMALYFFITIAAVVVAPVSTLPLLPIAANLWGPVPAALLSIVAWTIGATIAFWLARRWGRPLVLRLIGQNAVARLEQFVPREHMFISVVLLRMVLPVDAFSYALGLFTRMPFNSYVLATLIGVTPFAFVFAFLAGWPITWQIIIIAVVVVLLYIGYISSKKQES